jgi:DNA-directed DNA polymerase III PolC
MYINCHSYHSLRYGTISLDDLIPLARANGVKVMALTDINTVTGIYDFKKECELNDIKPVAGIEFRRNNRLLYIGLSKNKTGLSELCGLLTRHNLEKTELPDVAPEMKEVFIIYPLDKAPERLGKNEYIGLRPQELSKLIQAKWKHKVTKMVMWQPVTLRNKKEFNLNKILCATDLNVVLSRLVPEDHARITDRMLPVTELCAYYKDHPVIIRNTEEMLAQCHFEFDFKTPRNRKYYTGTKEGDRELLERLALEGMERRYGKHHTVAETEVRKELRIIDQLNFAAYFLINWDITQFSKQHGLRHVGRGSGANSIVSYCLEITAICPLELSLYFERFLNEGRTSPPDFDIDWSWQDRDTILEYIFNRFGRDRVAFCGTIGTFKHRSVIREIGKVFGLEKAEMDKLARTSLDAHEKNNVVKLVHEYGALLSGFPNLRSMHSCGVIIAEEPLINYTALEMPPKGFPIVQWDMDIAEDIGFEKFDILSQRGLGTINDSVKLIKKNKGIDVDIDDTTLSKNEARCNEHLKRGKTIGCFYIESPAMRGLLRKLKCDNYLTLVAASSIIRPGVAQGGGMGEYVVRHMKKKPFEYLHPLFEQHLSDTYGIMIYQEDVIKMAHHFAHMSFKDADTLRKGRVETKEYKRVSDLFFENCRKLGHSDKLIHEVYRQIRAFAGFSFCKAHSASYAVESYQSLYLKVYYPLEFMVSAINNFGGFYRTEVYLHEAKMSGAILHTPCINKSDYLTNLYGDHLYLGFNHIHDLPQEIGELIPAERELNGEYTSLENFINRVPAGIETIQILIFCGAFACTGHSKSELTLMARLYFKRSKGLSKHSTLFEAPSRNYTLPKVETSPMDDVFDEIELLGFPVSVSPFELLKTKYRGDVFARQLPDLHLQTVKMLGYLISIKDNPTKNGLMKFGTWIDAEGTYFDSVHFANTLGQYDFTGAGCYLLLGKVEVDLEFPSLIISKMAKLPFIPDPRYENDEDRSYRVHQNMRPDTSYTSRGPYPTAEESGIPRVNISDLKTIPVSPVLKSGSNYSMGNKR